MFDYTPFIIGLIIVLISITSIIIFIIYFLYKILQFVITATNLYKKMVNRLDANLKLLIDIRDNTKKYEASDLEKLLDDEATVFECDKCKAEVPADATECPNCGEKFD